MIPKNEIVTFSLSDYNKEIEDETEECFNLALTRFVKGMVKDDYWDVLAGLNSILTAIENVDTFKDFIWAKGRHQLGRIYYTENPFKAFVYSKQPRVPFNCRKLPKDATLFEKGQTPVIIFEDYFKKCFSRIDKNSKRCVREWFKRLDLDWPIVPTTEGTTGKPDTGRYKVIKQKKGNPKHYTKLDVLCGDLSKEVGKKINKSTFYNYHKRVKCFKEGVTKYKFPDGNLAPGYYVTPEALKKMVDYLKKK